MLRAPPGHGFRKTGETSRYRLRVWRVYIMSVNEFAARSEADGESRRAPLHALFVARRRARPVHSAPSRSTVPKSRSTGGAKPSATNAAKKPITVARA